MVWIWEDIGCILPAAVVAKNTWQAVTWLKAQVHSLFSCCICCRSAALSSRKLYFDLRSNYVLDLDLFLYDFMTNKFIRFLAHQQTRFDYKLWYCFIMNISICKYIIIYALSYNKNICNVPNYIIPISHCNYEMEQWENITNIKIFVMCSII